MSLTLAARAEEPQLLKTFTGPTKSIRSLAFSPDGKTLASAGDEKTIMLWDLATGTNTATLEGHTDYIHCVAFNANSSLLASAGEDGTVRLWDIVTGKSLHTIETNRPKSVSFSPDGKTLASGGWGKNKINLWNAVTGANLATA